MKTISVMTTILVIAALVVISYADVKIGAEIGVGPVADVKVNAGANLKEKKTISNTGVFKSAKFVSNRLKC